MGNATRKSVAFAPSASISVLHAPLAPPPIINSINVGSIFYVSRREMCIDSFYTTITSTKA
jgi:hypothetical protein